MTCTFRGLALAVLLTFAWAGPLAPLVDAQQKSVRSGNQINTTTGTADTLQAGGNKINAHGHEFDEAFLTNKTGGSAVNGDVYALDTANDSAFVAGDTVGGLQKFVVVVESISNNSAGKTAREGLVTAKSTGTINRGEYVRKSTTVASIETTGVAMAATTTPPVDAIGIALAGSSVGFTAILLFERPTVGTVTRSHLAGLTLANNGGDATNDIDIQVGTAANSTNVDMLTLASALTKQLDAAWAVGTNAGCRDTGVISDATWHIFVIKRLNTGVVDVLCSLSATAPTMPTAYTLQRRIGSIIRTAGALVAFTQTGDTFQRGASVADVSATDAGTTAVTRTLSVPTGIVVEALVAVNSFSNAARTYVRLSPLSVNDEAASASNSQVEAQTAGDTNGEGSWSGPITTNTSAQIRGRQSATAAGITLTIGTLGWIDRRGRDN